MKAEAAAELESAWPRIQAAARRYAGRDEADEIAAEIAAQAAQKGENLAQHLAPGFLPRRVEDARRRLYGTPGSKRRRPTAELRETATEALSPAEECSRARDEMDDAELAEWLTEIVDTGEPLRRLRDSRVALGGLPPRPDELADLADRVCAMWPHGRLLTRGELIGGLRKVRGRS